MKKLSMTLLVGLLSQSMMAATWIVNKDHSEIMFQVTYMSVSELNGRFNDFQGIAELSDKNIPTEITVKIKASSIDTGNKMRDGHLKDHDFLQADHHPEILFSSKNISQTGPGKFKATGPLVIKGISHPATFEFGLSDVVKDTWGYENRFVKFNSKINRKDYKIVWNKTLDGQQFLVGDEIGISGTFQMQPQGKKTPNSKHMIPDTEHIRERDQKRIEEESSFSKKLRKLINGK